MSLKELASDCTLTRHNMGEFSLNGIFKNPRIRIADLSASAMANLFMSLSSPDLIDKYQVSQSMDNQFLVFIEFRHFFKDLGLSKKHMSVVIEINEIFPTDLSAPTWKHFSITGKSAPISLENHANKPQNTEAIHLSKFDAVCKYSTAHECAMHASLTLDIAELNLPSTVETFMMSVIKKLISRSKTFIESM